MSPLPVHCHAPRLQDGLCCLCCTGRGRIAGGWENKEAAVASATLVTGRERERERRTGGQVPMVRRKGVCPMSATRASGQARKRPLSTGSQSVGSF